MIEILNSYLILHKSISIPGMGTIYVERVPANSDFVNRQILPPGYQFRFDKYFDAPDKEFFSFLSAEKQIADFEAIRLYNEWAYDLRNRLKGEEPVEWKGVGQLYQDANGEIHFQAQKSDRFPLKPVLRTCCKNNTAHTMLVGDKETTTLAMTELLTEYEYNKKTLVDLALISQLWLQRY